MHITLIAAFNHNFIAFISHLVTLLWPLSVVASYPPVITIVFPLLLGIPQAPAPLCFKANESPPERGNATLKMLLYPFFSPRLTFPISNYLPHFPLCISLAVQKEKNVPFSIIFLVFSLSFVRDIESDLSILKARYTKYGIWGAYLSALSMVEWGIPENILQNAVQTR